ncbi:hypothetical protein CS063_12820 [Sporanaerobium hydrogeniformans]|uniref:Uncharacterized protein n=1 Tax=Sporanaerobium hydrogeniformans TaxID=3072179 RepID=A0AC61DBU1_9FIRM|nr:ABC transporter permease [Sporanaerobium hydrogeniformans]PHV70022.1 hypothetical protein CS063_12820 [Sporanaerobium hydrogeniformans]
MKTFIIVKNSLKRKFAVSNYISFMLFFPLFLSLLFILVFSNMTTLKEEDNLKEQATYEKLGHFENQLYTVSYLEPKNKSESLPQPAIQIASTMLVFAILLQATYGMEQIHYLNQCVGKRVCLAPISKMSIYIGEYLASLLIALFEGIAISICMELFFKVGLSRNKGELFIIILCCSMMAIAVGIGIGLMIRDELVGSSLITFFILLGAFTSGGLTPGIIDFKLIKKFSFYTGITDSILDICQWGKVQHMGRLIMLTLGIGLFFISIGYVVAWRIKKWGDRHGD